ncbi:MAG: SPOR domain-containing protein [Burkholderiaceae bacterium]
MKTSRGGFLIGLIVGLLLGLVLALGVAMYVTKVPVPFINKVPQRTADQDAAEAERNKNWDPNAGLGAKPGSRPAAPAPAAPTTSTAPAMAPPPAPAAAPPAATPPAATAATPAARAASRPGATGLMFFAQAGAFTRADDAEAQRAKLALMGLDAKVTEREQAGRTVYRVRVGPFEARGQADAAIERLQAAGVDSTLVRVERQ